MPKNTNSASRLYALFLAAQGGEANAATFQVWQSVFKIEEATSHRLLMAVIEELLWVQEEIEILRSHMVQRGFSLGVYDAYLEQMQNAIQPLNLPNVWSATSSNYLRPEAMGFLALTAEMLPNEEIIISGEDVSLINNLVIELEALIGTGQLPPQLQAIVHHHIELIHKAIQRYPVSGVRSLRDAAWTAAGEILHAQNDPQLGGANTMQSPEVAKLNELWMRVNVIVDGAIKINSLYELGKNVVGLLGKPGS